MRRYEKNGAIKYLSDIVLLVENKQIINPSEKEVLENGWKIYIPKPVEPTVEEVKQKKLDEITAYDTSESVNSFTLDGEVVWLDKDTRVGLMNSTQIEKAAGRETTTLWFDGKSYTIPCDTAIQMLSALELYALQCYNVTAQHKANVEAMTDVEEIEAYNFTVNYPEKLNLQTK